MLAVALLTYFQFPGHTWLQQDSQIYVPILEHLRDPMVLRNDILVAQAPVAFTIYDEAARFLRGLTGLEFREVLGVEQIAARALGVWGLYLMASAMGLGPWPALMAAAICSLGAKIAGPEVLTFEYEPTPRAIALPLVICAVGLAAHRRYWAAEVAGAVALLYHPPTAFPFWVVFLVVLWVAKRARGLAMLAAAAAILAIAASAQAGGTDPRPLQEFFRRVTPLQEQLQRMRTAYVWISTWPPRLLVHHLILAAVVGAAFARVRRELPRDLAIFLLGLPLVGLAAMPLSWLLLEKAKWAMVPQVQPLRGLLFVALWMQFLTAVNGILAVQRRRLWESIGWFALAYVLPLHTVVTMPLAWRTAALVLALAALAVLVARFDWRMAPAGALAAFFAIPLVGDVVNYPQLHTPELAQLSSWARSSAPQDAVFLFPDAGRALFPGIFRAEARRAVYVDWKGGGQVNYLRDFGEQWWFRWQLTMAGGFHPADVAKYSGLGITYVVLQSPGVERAPVFENAKYAVYSLR